MSLHLVKPEVEKKLTNGELWLEIITICQQCAPTTEEYRKGLAKILDEHFIIYGRGGGL